MFDQSVSKFQVTTLLVSSLILAACSGGGDDGPGGKTEPAINEGSYSLDDFNYVDTHPVGYHPTGQMVTRCSRVRNYS